MCTFCIVAKRIAKKGGQTFPKKQFDKNKFSSYKHLDNSKDCKNIFSSPRISKIS